MRADAGVQIVGFHLAPVSTALTLFFSWAPLLVIGEAALDQRWPRADELVGLGAYAVGISLLMVSDTPATAARPAYAAGLGAAAVAAAAAAAWLLYMKRRVNYARRVQGARRQLAPTLALLPLPHSPSVSALSLISPPALRKVCAQHCTPLLTRVCAGTAAKTSRLRRGGVSTGVRRFRAPGPPVRHSFGILLCALANLEVSVLPVFCVGRKRPHPSVLMR